MGLFTAPLQAVSGVINSNPITGCLAAPLTIALFVYQIYLGYLGVRSSMNLEQTPAIITLVLTFVAQVVVWLILGFVFDVIVAALLAF